MLQILEELEIGPVRSEENCAQAGDEDYQKKARAECRAYARQVERHYPVPEGANVQVKRFPHDFGCYFEVAISGPAEWVHEVEEDPKRALRNWDEQARSALGLEKIEP